MNNYKFVSPQNFTEDHIRYIDDFKTSVKLLSLNSDIIFGAKDINSRHLISTDTYAQIVGLSNGEDVSGRRDHDMPCHGTAQYADCYVKEDSLLLNTFDPDQSISVLNIHNYSDGMNARVFKKRILCHKPSRSILGTVYSGYNIELKDVLNIIPSYIIRFGATSTIESTSKINIASSVHLTEYEEELCFLFLLNWEFKQIAEFMNKFRPEHLDRTADTVIKKKNYLCQKFNLNTTRLLDLQSFLVAMNFHNKMPKSFYRKIVGSTILT